MMGVFHRCALISMVCMTCIALFVTLVLLHRSAHYDHRYSEEIRTLQQRVFSLEHENNVLRKGCESVTPKLRTQQPSSKTTATKVSSVTRSYFCDPQVFTHKRWIEYFHKPSHSWHVEHMGGISHGRHNRTWFSKRWWCDKTRNDIDAFTPTKNLKTSDIVVGVYTGNSLYYGRAIATRTTWLSRFPKSMLFGPSDEPNVGIVGLRKYGVQPDTVVPGHVGLVQMFGLKELYLKYPNAKWYTMLGDDSYVQASRLVEMMSDYDYNEPVVYSKIVSTFTNVTSNTRIDFSAYPKALPCVRNRGVYKWAAGSVPFMVSVAAAKLYAQHVDVFLKHNPHLKFDARPDLNTGLVMYLSGVEYRNLRPNHMLRFHGYSCDGGFSRRDFVDCATDGHIYNHYARPWRQLAMDQWENHQLLDRMISGVAQGTIDLSFLLNHVRTFVDQHYDHLRRYALIVKYLIQNVGKAEHTPTSDTPITWNENFDDLPKNFAYYSRMESLSDSVWHLQKKYGPYNDTIIPE